MEQTVSMDTLVEMTQGTDPQVLETALQAVTTYYNLAMLNPKESMTLLTAKEISIRLGLTHESFKQLQSEVRLPKIKVGKSIRFPWILTVEALSKHAYEYDKHASLKDMMTVV